MNKFETSSVAELPENSSSEIPSASVSPEAKSDLVIEKSLESGLENNAADRLATTLEPAPEGALVKFESDIAQRQSEIATIEKEIAVTQDSLNAAREKLGLPLAARGRRAVVVEAISL